LPKIIIYIDIEDFINWVFPRIKEYMEKERLQSIIRFIENVKREKKKKNIFNYLTY